MGSVSNSAGAAPAVSGALPLTANRGQMDINMLYQKLHELGDLLRDNRIRTSGIVADVERYAARTVNNGPDVVDIKNNPSEATKLIRRNIELQSTQDLLLREQRENTRLIGDYESTIGSIVEQVRNLSFNKDSEKLKMSQEYNQLLQDEKDAHLRTRMEKDEWHSRFLQSVEMLRKSHKLQSEDEGSAVQVIAGLQNEVRSYRHALGIEAEQPEEECGYEFLRTG